MLVATDPAHSGVVYAGRVRLAKSTNSGHTWQVVNSPATYIPYQLQVDGSSPAIYESGYGARYRKVADAVPKSPWKRRRIDMQPVVIELPLQGGMVRRRERLDVCLARIPTAPTKRHARARLRPAFCPLGDASEYRSIHWIRFKWSVSGCRYVRNPF